MNETGGTLISSSLLRLSSNYDRHVVCHHTPMNAAGHKPDDDLPPPPPPLPPKIVEEKPELPLPPPPLPPLDTAGLMPSPISPNGLYPLILPPFCVTIESFLFYFRRPHHTSDTNQPRRFSFPVTVSATRSQVEKDEPTYGIGGHGEDLRRPTGWYY